MLTLTDSIYSGKPPVFETAEDAFLFMLKIMSWIPSSIILNIEEYVNIEDSRK